MFSAGVDVDCSPNPLMLGKVAADAGTTTVTEINVCPVVSCDKAQSLGSPMDTDLKGIIRDYVNTYIKK